MIEVAFIECEGGNKGLLIIDKRSNSNMLIMDEDIRTLNVALSKLLHR